MSTFLERLKVQSKVAGPAWWLSALSPCMHISPTMEQFLVQEGRSSKWKPVSWRAGMPSPSPGCSVPFIRPSLNPQPHSAPGFLKELKGVQSEALNSYLFILSSRKWNLKETWPPGKNPWKLLLMGHGGNFWNKCFRGQSCLNKSIYRVSTSASPGSVGGEYDESVFPSLPDSGTRGLRGSL